MAGSLVREQTLYTDGRAIAVGSPAWFVWLESARHFSYEGAIGRFGARRERFQRGGWYWKAYRRVGGRLRRAYLGRAEDLTAERMARAAAALEDADQAGLARPEEPPAILWTKLSPPPPRSGVVARAALAERLNAALTHRVTVVIAPAGWGKTTLLASWLSALGVQGPARAVHGAWLSLDPTDDDPARLWSYICAALGMHEPSVLTAEAAFRNPRILSVDHLMAALINAVGGPQAARKPPIVLVLDDYHTLTSPLIHEAVAFLVDRMPARLHLVIATRSAPPLPLARWRAAGWVLELRADDLRFGLDDSAALLAGVTGRAYPPETVRTLVERTEGWAAGLQLAGLALRGGEIASGDQIRGSHPYILDYLIDEILQRQQPAVQEFLLHTCILDRMCGELCDAVLDDGRWTMDDGRWTMDGSSLPSDRTPAIHGRSSVMLAELERHGLFVAALDNERRWFRYHQLFADALREVLRRERPALEPELLRRAARWFADQANSGAEELIAPAVEYALAAGTVDLAADLIERHINTMLWVRGEVRTLLRWISTLPMTLRLSRPDLVLAEAWSLLVMVQIDRLIGLLTELEANLGPDPAPRLQGEIAALRSFAARISGELPESIELGRRALALLAEERCAARYLVAINQANSWLVVGDLVACRRALDDVRAAERMWTVPSAVAIAANAQLLEAGLLLNEGHAPEAERLIRRALASAHSWVGRLTPTGLCYASLSEVRYMRGDLDEAERAVRLAITHGEQWWNSDVLCAGHDQLGRVLRARGDLAGAAAEFRRARELVLAYQVPHIEYEIQLDEAWEALDRGDLAEVGRVLRERELPGAGSLDHLAYREYELHARFELLQGHVDAAIERVLWMRQIAERGRFTLRLIVAERLLARALHTAGRRVEALDALGRAIMLAAPGDMVRAIIDEGEPLRDLLLESASAGPVGERGFATKLLGFLPGAATRPAAAGVEPLTAREAEVLALVAMGASNLLIAERLIVSLHTVKKHLTHIFAKLGTSSRTAAVARARALGLIS